MSEETTMPQTQAADAVPAYLKGETEGLDQIKKFQARSRLKIVHATSGKGLQEEHGLGTMILSPDGLKVAAFNEPVDAVPLFFWPSWQQRRDNKDNEYFIVSEEYDQAGEIAVKSRSQDTRKEPYGPDGKWNYTFAECLNFMFHIRSGEAAGTMGVGTFSVGDVANGRRLNSYIARQNLSPYTNVIRLMVVQKEGGGNVYYAMDFKAHKENAKRFVPEDQLASYRAMHAEMKNAYTMGSQLAADETE